MAPENSFSDLDQRIVSQTIVADTLRPLLSQSIVLARSSLQQNGNEHVTRTPIHIPFSAFFPPYRQALCPTGRQQDQHWQLRDSLPGPGRSCGSLNTRINSSPAGRPLRFVQPFCAMPDMSNDLDDVRYEHHLTHRGSANRMIFIMAWAGISAFLLVSLGRRACASWRGRRYVTQCITDALNTPS